MGRNTDNLIAFITEMSDEKLLALGDGSGKCKDDHFYTQVSQASQASELHVISILGSKLKNGPTSAVLAGKIVDQIKVPSDGSWTASQIRQEFMDNRLI